VPVDKIAILCYTIIVPRERTDKSRKAEEKNQENFKKALDKSLSLWYNKYIKGKDTLQTRKDLIP
jgi:hypothetical protein